MALAERKLAKIDRRIRFDDPLASEAERLSNSAFSLWVKSYNNDLIDEGKAALRLEPVNALSDF